KRSLHFGRDDSRVSERDDSRVSERDDSRVPGRDDNSHGVRSNHAIWWALVGSIVVVALLYGCALGFSFLFDDTFDLPRVEGRSYFSLLTSSEGYSYYRPGPFLIWKFTHDLLGYYSQPLLHALTLAAHALTGWLLYLLIARL